MKEIVQYVRITHSCPDKGKILPVLRTHPDYFRFTLGSYYYDIHKDNCELVSISINPQKEQETDIDELEKGFYDWEKRSGLNRDEIEDACMFHNHAFGLLEREGRIKEMIKALFWHNAWTKVKRLEWQKQQVQDKGFCISDEQIAELHSRLKGETDRSIIQEMFPSASCFKAPVTYSVGQRFDVEHDGVNRKAILSVQSSGRVCFTDLASGFMVKNWAIEVDDVTSIKEEEMSNFSKSYRLNFTLIQPES